MAEALDSNSDVEEGEDEPLFADDLGDEDDLPPLPPPVPTLSTQLQNSISTSTQRSTSGVGTGADPPVPQTNDQGPPLKKRKPILTLTVDRIFSEKGLPYIEREFPKLKFKGKAHEVSDLQFLMKQYEHWANRLYPKYTFKDVTQRIERLSTTKEFKNRLLDIRRRHARGGQATPPLVDSDEEEVPTQGPVDRNGGTEPVVNGNRVSSSPESFEDGVLSPHGDRAVSHHGERQSRSSPHSADNGGSSPPESDENRTLNGDNSRALEDDSDMDSDDIMPTCTVRSVDLSGEGSLESDMDIPLTVDNMDFSDGNT